MKKGQSYEGYVENVVFPSKGIVMVEGEENKAVVKNVLPGQKIQFRVTKKRKGKAEGMLEAVLEKSADEVEAECPHFGICGGCNYQNLPYDKQLELKAGQVRSLLDAVYINRNETIGYTFEGIKESPRQYGYRNKMEFSFGDEYKEGPLSLGLHKRGSFYDIVPVTGCMIVDDDYRLILQTVLNFFGSRNVSYFHRVKQNGYLRHLLVRKAVKTGQILVALVTSSDVANLPCEEKSLLDDFTKELLALQTEGRLEGSFAGIIHTVNDAIADVVKADRNEILYGQDYFYEELMGLQFKISQFSFFQTNSLGAEVLYDTARNYILDGKNGLADQVVFDLYSGTGTIAQMMAPVCKKVIGVEIVEEAVEAARKNAELNGLHNCEFIAGDVLKVIDSISEKPDFIILDPPRDGIHPKALQKILDYDVDNIVYISCKPTSLARDLEAFLDRGYQMRKVCCVDMFPATANVETVVLLSHKKPDGHINVKVEFGEGEGKVPLDNIAKRAEEYKPKERVTYKMIKEYIEAKYGFKVHTAYIAEVKRDLGLPMYDAPNAIEELKQPRKHPTAEKVEAIRDALKHFEVI